MAMDDITRKVVHTGDGVQTAFPFAFSVFAENQVEVYYASESVDEMVVPTTDYSVELSEDGTGGTVIFEVSPEAGSRIAILSKVPYTQEMALTNYGGFNPETINDNADVQCAQIQQLREVLDRCIKLGPTSTMTAEEFMEAFFRAAELTRQYMDMARFLALSFKVPNGMVVAMYNVTVVNRNPVPWGTTRPDESWLLCDGGPDGATGTVPDLIGKMIRGSMPADQGQESGNDFIRITYDQLPRHSHATRTVGVSGWHTHTPGSLNIKGSFGADSPNYEPRGAFYNAGGQGYGQKDRGGGMIVGFDASRGFEGVTSAAGEHSHNVLMDPAGNGAQVDIRPVTYTLAYFVKVPQQNAGPSDWTRPIPDDPVTPFNVGDIIYSDYVDPVNNVLYEEYNYIVVDKDVEKTLVDRSTGKVVILQAQNLLPWEMSYNPEAFFVSKVALAPGRYTVYIDYWASFTLSVGLPAGGLIACPTINGVRCIRAYAPDGISIIETVPLYKNVNDGVYLGATPSADEVEREYGYFNNVGAGKLGGRSSWLGSAIQQYLNSDAPAGQWWSKRTRFGIAPPELLTRAGYLAGLPQNIKSRLRQVRVQTFEAFRGMEESWDRVWLPAVTEISVHPGSSSAAPGPYSTLHGEPLQYWVDEHGSPGGWPTLDDLITRPVDDTYSPSQMDPKPWHLRATAAFMNNDIKASSITGVLADGTVTNGYEKIEVPRCIRPLLAIQ